MEKDAKRPMSLRLGRARTVTVYVSEELWGRFRDRCKERGVSMSSQVERLVEGWLG